MLFLKIYNGIFYSNLTFKLIKLFFLRLSPSGELMVKRENNPWIVAKRSDMRELIITVNDKNANLKEISGKIYINLFVFLL